MGFHIVTQLLENGYQVDGIVSENNAKQTHLSMFLGRNSDFKLKTEDDLNIYDTAITVGTYTVTAEIINATRQFQIIRGEKEQQLENTITVRVPLLFGEWMPMNEKGMFIGEQFIQFDSNYFQTEAVYIEDFINVLRQWLKTEDLPGQLKMCADNTAESAAQPRKYKTNMERLTQVLEHYRRFQHFYEL